MNRIYVQGKMTRFKMRICVCIFPWNRQSHSFTHTFLLFCCIQMFIYIFTAKYIAECYVTTTSSSMSTLLFVDDRLRLKATLRCFCFWEGWNCMTKIIHFISSLLFSRYVVARLALCLSVVRFCLGLRDSFEGGFFFILLISFVNSLRNILGNYPQRSGKLQY